jgi:hypothetical protein
VWDAKFVGTAAISVRLLRRGVIHWLPFCGVAANNEFFFPFLRMVAGYFVVQVSADARPALTRKLSAISLHDGHVFLVFIVEGVIVRGNRDEASPARACSNQTCATCVRSELHLAEGLKDSTIYY